MATEQSPPRPCEGHTYEGDTASLPSPQLCGTRCQHSQAGDLQVGAERITSKTKKERGESRTGSPVLLSHRTPGTEVDGEVSSKAGVRQWQTQNEKKFLKKHD